MKASKAEPPATPEESSLYQNLCLLSVIQPGQKQDSSLDLNRTCFRRSNNKALEHVLYHLFCACKGRAKAQKEFKAVWPVSDKAQQGPFYQKMGEWIKELKDSGKLDHSHNMPPSALKTATGTRVVALLLDLSWVAVQAAFQADAAVKGLPSNPQQAEGSYQSSDALRITAAACRAKHSCSSFLARVQREDKQHTVREQVASELKAAYYHLQASLTQNLGPGTYAELDALLLPLPAHEPVPLEIVARISGGTGAAAEGASGGAQATGQQQKMANLLASLKLHLCMHAEKLAPVLSAVSGSGQLHPHQLDGHALSRAAEAGPPHGSQHAEASAAPAAGAGRQRNNVQQQQHGAAHPANIVGAVHGFADMLQALAQEVCSLASSGPDGGPPPLLASPNLPYSHAAHLTHQLQVHNAGWKDLSHHDQLLQQQVAKTGHELRAARQQMKRLHVPGYYNPLDLDDADLEDEMDTASTQLQLAATATSAMRPDSHLPVPGAAGSSLHPLGTQATLLMGMAAAAPPPATAGTAAATSAAGGFGPSQSPAWRAVGAAPGTGLSRSWAGVEAEAAPAAGGAVALPAGLAAGVTSRAPPLVGGYRTSSQVSGGYGNCSLPQPASSTATTGPAASPQRHLPSWSQPSASTYTSSPSQSAAAYGATGPMHSSHSAFGAGAGAKPAGGAPLRYSDDLPGSLAYSRVASDQAMSSRLGAPQPPFPMAGAGLRMPPHHPGAAAVNGHQQPRSQPHSATAGAASAAAPAVDLSRLLLDSSDEEDAGFGVQRLLPAAAAAGAGAALMFATGDNSAGGNAGDDMLVDSGPVGNAFWSSLAAEADAVSSTFSGQQQHALQQQAPEVGSFRRRPDSGEWGSEGGALDEMAARGQGQAPPSAAGAAGAGPGIGMAASAAMASPAASLTQSQMAAATEFGAGAVTMSTLKARFHALNC